MSELRFFHDCRVTTEIQGSAKKPRHSFDRLSASVLIGNNYKHTKMSAATVVKCTQLRSKFGTERVQRLLVWTRESTNI